MKNLKNITVKTSLLFLSVIIVLAIAQGCSENSSLTSPSFSTYENENSHLQGEKISVQVRKGKADGYYFAITNNTQDTTINDFHVQFIDTTLNIIGFSVWSSGWMIMKNASSLNKGKISIKTNPQDPNADPIRPGTTGRPLYIGVRMGRRNTSIFNWQATQDGAVVGQGIDSLPR